MKGKKTVKSILVILAVCIILSAASILSITAEDTKITTNKDSYNLKEAVNVTITGLLNEDWVCLYQKDKIPGTHSAIFYAVPDNTLSGRGNYAEVKNGVTYNCFTWYCANTENVDVKPFIDVEGGSITLKENKYKIVVRRNGQNITQKEFEVKNSVERNVSISLDKTSYIENEAVNVKISGSQSDDYVVVYGKDKVPGVHSGIYYAAFDTTMSGRESYTKLTDNVASNLISWYCHSPSNGDVKPFINPETKNLVAGDYTIVVRNGSEILANKELHIEAEVIRDVSISLDKTSYIENEAVNVKISGSQSDDYVVVYGKDKVPGVHSGIYYAAFDTTMSGRESYTKLTDNVTSNLISWYCHSPSNGDVKPFINPETKNLVAGDYTIVVRNGSKILASKELHIEAEVVRDVKLAFEKDSYTEGDAINLTVSGLLSNDTVVIYQKDKIPGTHGGIYYACIDNTVAGKESYTVIENGKAGNICKWSCPTPENADVSAFINADTKELKAGEYKVVVRNGSSIVAEMNFTISAAPAVDPVDPPSTGDNTVVLAVFAAAAIVGMLVIVSKKQRENI